MKTQLGLAAVLIVLGVGIGSLAVARSDETKTAKSANYVSSRGGDWQDAPHTRGVQQLAIAGIPDKGAYEMFAKFVPGADHGWHTHTNDVRIVVVSGAYVYRDESGKETRVKAGDYLFVPGGTKHWSGSDEGCIFYQTSPAKFDLIPVKK
jgi:quercetin dioxygenase-like cupin family protein